MKILQQLSTNKKNCNNVFISIPSNQTSKILRAVIECTDLATQNMNVFVILFDTSPTQLLHAIIIGLNCLYYD